MLRFKKGEIPDLEFRPAVKKPIPMRVCQINEDFEVETEEGTLKAEAGDYLIVGYHGEMWSIKKDIFRDTYEFLDKK